MAKVEQFEEEVTDSDLTVTASRDVSVMDAMSRAALGGMAAVLPLPELSISAMMAADFAQSNGESEVSATRERIAERARAVARQRYIRPPIGPTKTA